MDTPKSYSDVTAEVKKAWKKVSEHPDHNSNIHSEEYSGLVRNLRAWMQIEEEMFFASSLTSETTTEADDKDFEPDDLFFDTDR